MKRDKQAYLIIAYNNFEQLSFLLGLLDYPYVDIYLLIDKKSNLTVADKNNILGAVKKSKVYFVPRINIYWGDFSLVKAEFILFRSAYNKSKYSYYHLISGSDLPLRPESQIFDFFDNHRNKIFIRLAKADKQAENRVKYRQVLIRYRQRSNSPKVINYSAKVINKIGIRVQKLLGINIIKKYKIKVGIGSEWVSLDTSTVKLILDNEIWIAKVFSNSVCSDELFIPTLLNKYSEFQKKIWKAETNPDKPGELFGNMRYINWWAGSPYTWKEGDEKDIEIGIKSGNLFSRKFNLKKSPKLKEYILKKNRIS